MGCVVVSSESRAAWPAAAARYADVVNVGGVASERRPSTFCRAHNDRADHHQTSYQRPARTAQLQFIQAAQPEEIQSATQMLHV